MGPGSTRIVLTVLLSLPLLAAAPPARPVAAAPVERAWNRAVDPPGAPAYAVYHDSSGYRPKDFSFITDDAGRLHLFFMRQDARADTAIYSGKRLVHVWTDDLTHWSSQDSSFTVGTTWDGLSLWAPAVIRAGNAYYLYYTGIDPLTLDQSIGNATSPDLNAPGSTWTRHAWPSFTASNTAWAARPARQQQLRDPFVLRDPADTTRFLMLYSAELAGQPGKGCIGVARSAGPAPTGWSDLGPILETSYPISHTDLVESPAAFPHINAGHAPADTSWYLMFVDWWSPGSLSFDINAHTPADLSTLTGPGHWGPIDQQIYGWVGDDPRVADWGNGEYFRWAGREYLAGYVSTAPEIHIVRLEWTARGASLPDSFSLASVVTAVTPPRAPDPAPGVSLRLARPPGGGGEARLAITLPGAMDVRLEIFDPAGRRIRTLFAGTLLAGMSPLVWDGHAGDGAAAAPGIYLARLRWSGGWTSVRVPLLR